MPGQPFQLPSHLEELPEFWLVIEEVLQTLRLREGLVKGKRAAPRQCIQQGCRLKFCQLENPADIPENLFSSEGPKSNNLRHPLMPVLPMNICQNFLPAVVGNIQVDIRHLCPLWVKETFE